LFAKPKEIGTEKLDTIIGKDTHLEGTIRAKGTIRVDGRVEGQLVSEGDLVIGDTGKIQGDIKAKNVIVSGKVLGNLIVQGKVEMSPSGSVQGDITAAKLVIDEGAIFDGNCSMQHKGDQVIKFSEKERYNNEKLYSDA